MGKGVPFSGVDLTICNVVNSAIYKAYPWRDVLKNFTEVTLTDGNQDFSATETDIYRVTQFWIARTDVTPNDYRDIGVRKSLSIDLSATTPYSIRAASYQAAINKFRLEKAVRISSGSTFKIGGE